MRACKWYITSIPPTSILQHALELAEAHRHFRFYSTLCLLCLCWLRVATLLGHSLTRRIGCFHFWFFPGVSLAEPIETNKSHMCGEKNSFWGDDQGVSGVARHLRDPNLSPLPGLSGLRNPHGNPSNGECAVVFFFWGGSVPSSFAAKGEVTRKWLAAPSDQKCQGDFRVASLGKTQSVGPLIQGRFRVPFQAVPKRVLVLQVFRQGRYRDGKGRGKTRSCKLDSFINHEHSTFILLHEFHEHFTGFLAKASAKEPVRGNMAANCWLPKAHHGISTNGVCSFGCARA